MSEIGNYIHYRSRNYKKFGIYRKDEGSNDFSSVVAQAHSQLKQLVKDKSIKSDLKELEKYYNNLLYGDKLYEPISTGDDSQDEITLLSILTDYINSNVDHYAKDWDVARALTSPTSSLFNRPPQKWAKLKYINTHQIDEYLKALTEAKRKIPKLLERNMVSPEKMKQEEEQIKQICNNFIEQLEALEQEIIETSDIRTKVGGDRKKSYKAAILDGNLRFLLESLNSFLSLYRGYYGSSLAGPGFEALITLANIGVNNTLKKGASKIIGKDGWEDYLKKHGHTGNNSTFVYVDNLSGDFVDIDELASGMGSSWKVGSQQGRVDFQGGVNETVDVVIENLSNEELNGIIADGERLNASLKNYSDINTSRGISMLSDSPLLSILNLFNADFINHYLNLLGVHPPADLSSDFEEATYWVKYAAAIRALSGVRKSDSYLQTDILVINDRQSRRIIIKKVKDILDMTTIDNFNTYFKVSGMPTKQGGSDWNNWVLFKSYNIQTRKGNDGYLLAKERITKYLLKIHGTKISVSMTPAALS